MLRWYVGLRMKNSILIWNNFYHISYGKHFVYNIVKSFGSNRIASPIVTQRQGIDISGFIWELTFEIYI